LSPSQTGLDRRIRAEERLAYAEAGLEPRERIVGLDVLGTPAGVRVLELGSAEDPRTPVLLLHGIASPSVLFTVLLPFLEGRRSFVVDWPGHGLSSPLTPDPTTGLRRHAVAVLGGLLDGLGVDVVDLVGHSLGAQFGLYGALDLPDRVRRLVMLGAPGAGYAGVSPVTAMKVLAVPGLGAGILSLPTSDALFRRNGDATLGPGVTEGLPRHVYETAKLVATRHANASSIAGFFRAILARGAVRPGVPVLPHELATLTQPVLHVWGTRDVFLTPAAGAASSAAIRHGRLLTLDAGHAPWLEHPAEVGTAVADHLGAGEPG
jgi:pimeloyl-ACP methyl ester carboxylesterase